MANGESAVARARKQNRVKDQSIVDEADELANAVVRANDGDGSGLSRIQQLVAEDPAFAIEFLQGDLAKHAESALVRRIAGKHLAFREGLYAKLDAMRTELAGNNPNAIERLLAERVVVCWLQVCAADEILARAEQVTFAEGDYLQRRLDRAHRRYLSAIKMLAVVRRLALPIRVDVNVAGTVETKSAESPTMTARRRWAPEYVDN